MDSEQNGPDQTNSNPEQDYAGYPDLDGLRSGYRSSGAEAKRWRDRASLLEQQLQQVAQPRTQSADPYQRLADYGVPPEELRAAVQQTVGDLFQPLARGFEARNRVLVKYPDYNKFESDVAQYLASDEELSQSYQKMFSADPVAAMEYAYLKFGENKRGSRQPRASNANGEAPHTDAQIPSSRSGDSRRGDDAGRQNMKDLWEQAQKTGNVQPYVKARLRQVIPDSFFNQ